MRARGASRLIVIGTIAGVFSGLFGVGGGVVMLPLLTLWLGYDEREAAGIQALYGNVDADDAGLLAGPAVVGVLVGTWLAQRIPTRAISLLFALMLLATAVELVIS